MRTHKKIHLPLLLAAMLIFISACSPSATPNAEATFNPMVTAAAQTMEALLTQAANQVDPSGTDSSGNQTLPSATPIPTYTLMPTFTPFLVTQAPTSTTFVLTPNVPVPTAVTRCDWVQYVTDVTVPDGTTYEPGTSFVKTWRLKNIGTCTWTTGYKLVFFSGDQMGGTASVPLTTSVAPGQTVDVSVSLTAPATDGAYTGYWKLQNAGGVNFGIGSNATNSFYVKINVKTTSVTGIIYDFAEQTCDAKWSSDANADITCPSSSGSDGFMKKIPEPILENNSTGFSPAILAHPEDVNDGYITGKFPAFVVEQGDHFKADVGCQYGSSTCFVRFALEYKEVGDPDIFRLWEWDEKYDNKIAPVDVDLSDLKGKNVRFFLRIESLGDPSQDNALWYAPRIIRTVPISGTQACQIVSQTPAKNTSYTAGDDFDAVWKVKNVSSEFWLVSGVDLVYLGGADMHKYLDLYDLPLEVDPGETITLTIDMQAPASNGFFSEMWALKKGSTTICTMAVTIKVPAP